MVLDGGEELHDDVDLFLDEDLDHVVVHADHRVVVEIEHFDWLVSAAIEVLEPQQIICLVQHVRICKLVMLLFKTVVRCQPERISQPVTALKFSISHVMRDNVLKITGEGKKLNKDLKKNAA